MTDQPDPRLIANALRFLAAGFDMAGESGVAAVLRRTDGGTDPSPYAAGLPQTVRATWSGDLLRLDHFSARLPFDFLRDSIGGGTNRQSLRERPGRAWLRTGMAERDGSETYQLERVDLSYSDVAGSGFTLGVEMQLGEPVRETFVYGSPVDRSGETYEAAIDVAFDAMFAFLFPVTKAQAEAIVARIFEAFAVRIDSPKFYVSN